MKKKDWEQQLRERMDTWQEPVPDALWHDIEKRLSPRRRRRWWVVAAAAVVSVVFGVGCFYRHVHGSRPFEAVSAGGAVAASSVAGLSSSAAQLSSEGKKDDVSSG